MVKLGKINVVVEQILGEIDSDVQLAADLKFVEQGKINEMNEELWKAKKIVDSTLHPGRCCWSALGRRY